MKLIIVYEHYYSIIYRLLCLHIQMAGRWRHCWRKQNPADYAYAISLVTKTTSSPSWHILPPRIDSPHYTLSPVDFLSLYLLKGKRKLPGCCSCIHLHAFFYLILFTLIDCYLFQKFPRIWYRLPLILVLCCASCEFWYKIFWFLDGSEWNSQNFSCWVFLFGE